MSFLPRGRAAGKLPAPDIRPFGTIASSDSFEQYWYPLREGQNDKTFVRDADHELPDFELPWGAFGENLTTDGLSEEDVRIGDRFGIGSAEFVVTQPRMPCFKLTIRFGRADMIKRFYRSGRSGFYFAVAKEGEIGPGDAITLLNRDPDAITIAEAFAR